MKCPACGYGDSKVIDSRPTDNGSIRRRRECLACQRRYTTYEIIEALPIIVVKKDGSREVFNRNKIITGLLKSCYKRPVTINQINAIAADIESELQNSLIGEVKSVEIGNAVMEKLKKVDEVSYVRFASVYREFRDVETFMNELSVLRSSDNDDITGNK